LAAHEQTELNETQILHDVSWVQTQINEMDRRYLSNIHDRILDDLRRHYGPSVIEAGLEEKTINA